MAKSKGIWKQILVVGVLCVILAGVIYAMRYTQSYQFRKGLEILFNPSAPTKWKWCPDGAEKVELLRAQDQIPHVDPAQICEVTVEAVPEEKAKRNLSPLLKVSSQTLTKTLEADENLEVFRVDGLIFQSRLLSQALKRP